MKVPKYVWKKVGWYSASLLIAISINFILPRLMPGNPAYTIIGRITERSGGTEIGEEVVEALLEQFGLNVPLHVQFLNYLANLFRGDIGRSLAYWPTPVWDIIVSRLPWSIGLLLTSTVIAWVTGNLLGAYISWRKESRISGVILVASMCMNRIPYYLLGLVLVYLFAYVVPVFPSGGGYSFFLPSRNILTVALDIIYHATLPALSMVIVSSGGWMLTMRALLINILGSDYLNFAKLKGLEGRDILLKYAVRNALLQQVTGLSMSLGFIFTGSMIMEYVFSYPGLGYVFVQAINARDYYLMQGIFLFTMIAVILGALILDLIYPLIDPRIRHERT